jgi:hypothetical protein
LDRKSRHSKRGAGDSGAKKSAVERALHEAFDAAELEDIRAITV